MNQNDVDVAAVVHNAALHYDLVRRGSPHPPRRADVYKQFIRRACQGGSIPAPARRQLKQLLLSKNFYLSFTRQLDIISASLDTLNAVNHYPDRQRLYWCMHQLREQGLFTTATLSVEQVTPEIQQHCNYIGGLILAPDEKRHFDAHGNLPGEKQVALTRFGPPEVTQQIDALLNMAGFRLYHMSYRRAGDEHVLLVSSAFYNPAVTAMVGPQRLTGGTA